MEREPEEVHTWIDSGATSHYTTPHMKLEVIDQVDNEHVRMANGALCSVTAKGNYKLKLGKNILTIKGAKRVEGMENNLLSVAQITDTGKEVLFTKNEAIILCDGKKLCTFPRRGNLYGTKTATQNRASIVRGSMEHIRLGHPGKRVMRTLKTAYPNIVKGAEGLCEPCELGKTKRRQHFKSQSKTSKPLELIHIDIAGPDPIVGFDESRYFIVLVDDFTRYIKTFTTKVRTGEQITKVIEQYIYRMESGTKYRVKGIRTDQAAEFRGAALKELLKKRNIRHQFSVAHDHEQNGTAERWIQTLRNTARANLTNANMPTKYWPLAISIATTQLNSRPNSIRRDTTPYRMMYGKNPDYKRMKEFGALATIWLHPVQRNSPSKFENPGIRCIFVGYPTNMKALKFLIPSEDKIIITNNARIHEGHYYWQDMNSKKNSFEEVTNIRTQSEGNEMAIGTNGEGTNTPRRSSRIRRQPDRLIDRMNPRMKTYDSSDQPAENGHTSNSEDSDTQESNMTAIATETDTINQDTNSEQLSGRNVLNLERLLGDGLPRRTQFPARKESL